MLDQDKSSPFVLISTVFEDEQNKGAYLRDEKIQRVILFRMGCSNVHHCHAILGCYCDIFSLQYQPAKKKDLKKEEFGKESCLKLIAGSICSVVTCTLILCYSLNICTLTKKVTTKPNHTVSHTKDTINRKGWWEIRIGLSTIRSIHSLTLREIPNPSSPSFSHFDSFQLTTKRRIMQGSVAIVVQCVDWLRRVALQKFCETHTNLLALKSTTWSSLTFCVRVVKTHSISTIPYYTPVFVSTSLLRLPGASHCPYHYCGGLCFRFKKKRTPFLEWTHYFRPHKVSRSLIFQFYACLHLIFIPS